MSRSPLVVGNWKMHGSQGFIKDFFANFQCDPGRVNVAIVPPYIYLPLLQTYAANIRVQWGAQNVSAQQQGAYTGEVSVSMLQDFQCQYVLVGHSERRCLYGETDADVREKCKVALQAGLQPIVCVGESWAAREAGEAVAVITAQCEVVLSGIELTDHLIFAYEPVWAIGTGKVPTVEQVQTVHAAIRRTVEKYDNEIAKRMRILYGGSVKPSNCSDLFSAPDVDGGLIGGASLQPHVFKEVIEICNKSC